MDPLVTLHSLSCWHLVKTHQNNVFECRRQMFRNQMIRISNCRKLSHETCSNAFFLLVSIILFIETIRPPFKPTDCDHTIWEARAHIAHTFLSNLDDAVFVLYEFNYYNIPISLLFYEASIHFELFIIHIRELQCGRIVDHNGPTETTK